MHKLFSSLLLLTLMLYAFAFPNTMSLAEETASPPPLQGITSSENVPINLPVMAPTDHLDSASNLPGTLPEGVDSPADPAVQFPPSLEPPPPPPEAFNENQRLPVFDPSLSFPASPSDELLSEPPSEELPLPLRPAGNWFTSAWFLILLVVLMVVAFLIYIAITEGRWPVHKPETPGKKAKKGKK